jgi:thioesterase domain-containing protein
VTAPTPNNHLLLGATDNPVLLPLGHRTGSTRSALFHPLGGGLGQYLGLVSHLARKGSVHGLRALGLYPGERPDTAVPAMVGRYTDLLRRLPEQPNLLVGWSLGGLLAWEAAQSLAVGGQPPDVVLIDSSPRSWRVDDPALIAVRERVMQQTVAQLGSESVAPVRDTLDAHIAARAGYQVGSRHHGRALLVTCSGSDEPDQADRWAALADDLTVRTLDCDHFDVFSRSNLPLLTGFVDDFLAA